MQYLDRLPPEAFWARYAEMEERIRATAAVLPFYGVAGWGGLVMIGDWQWENEQLVSIGLAHGARTTSRNCTCTPQCGIRQLM